MACKNFKLTCITITQYKMDTIIYDNFLKNKRHLVPNAGIKQSALNSKLFDFQKYTVNEALEKGRFGIFAGCGLGKTYMELEFAKQVSDYKHKPVLLITPLAVGKQLKKMGIEFGYNSIGNVGSDSQIEITNYEQLHNINPNNYSGVVLDESSIIKSHEGAYRNILLQLFKNTEFKLAATATPAPNDPMELGNHSELLNQMSRNEMLSMFFVHDGGDTAKWRLKGHSKQRFYEYCRQWSIMYTKPSDIGFSDCGFELPNLIYHEHQIKTENRGLALFNDVAVSATSFNKELRITMEARMNKAAEIVNASNENFLVWINHNAEEQYLKNLIPDAVVVTGSDDVEYKEEMLLAFAENQYRILITKPKIASFGLNYQNCHNTVFASLDFSFERIYQAVRRFLRFKQTHDVNAHLITTDTMQNVIETIKRKEQQFYDMQQGWINIFKNVV